MTIFAFFKIFKENGYKPGYRKCFDMTVNSKFGISIEFVNPLRCSGNVFTRYILITIRATCNKLKVSLSTLCQLEINRS